MFENEYSRQEDSYKQRIADLEEEKEQLQVSIHRETWTASFLVWSQSLIVIITSWFAIAPDKIRTRRILREKAADCKQSKRDFATLYRSVKGGVTPTV